MARGELIKKLLASYGHEDDFRSVVEQIISEEEKKNNRGLARSLRKTLDNVIAAKRPVGGLSRLIPFPDEANDFIQRIEPARSLQDILLSPENTELFLGLIREFRQADRIRPHGLPIRSKLLSASSACLSSPPSSAASCSPNPSPCAWPYLAWPSSALSRW